MERNGETLHRNAVASRWKEPAIERWTPQPSGTLSADHPPHARRGGECHRLDAPVRRNSASDAAAYRLRSHVASQHEHGRAFRRGRDGRRKRAARQAGKGGQ